MNNENIITLGDKQFRISADGHHLDEIKERPQAQPQARQATRPQTNDQQAFAQLAREASRLKREALQNATPSQARKTMVKQAQRQGCITGFLWALTAGMFGAVFTSRHGRRRSYRRR